MRKKSNGVILLNRMYAGRYLKDNIGHEVINLFKSDNGNNYIYVNEHGTINKKYNDSVNAVLLVRYIDKNVMEVIAKAEQLEQVLYKAKDIKTEGISQIKYVDDNQVTYGGVPLYKIYNDTYEEKRVITFKTNSLRLAKRPIYLVEDEDKQKQYSYSVFLPEKHFSTQSLKMYYSENEFPNDYEVLEELLSEKKLWESTNTTKEIDINTYSSQDKGNSIFRIIRKEYDELAYSNILTYLFEQDRNVFVDFAKKVLGISDFSSDFEIVRESKHNIDIWIEDESHVIVIENKIKSKINGERHDVYSHKIQSQLNKYYACAKTECNDKEIRCFLFSPNYNNINLSNYTSGEKYTIIKYSQIYDYYFKNAGHMIHIDYFKEFLDALEIHSKTIDNSNFEVMKNRFILKIRRILELEKC